MIHTTPNTRLNPPNSCRLHVLQAGLDRGTLEVGGPPRLRRRCRCKREPRRDSPLARSVSQMSEEMLDRMVVLFNTAYYDAKEEKPFTHGGGKNRQEATSL